MRQGFTLLELSIVLVIIGLLIGGIFVGQSLIHTAQLNAVVTEFNRYQTATQNFKQQYQALPGDMNNAVSFWGSAGGTGADATCATTASTTAATCNGNGDGNVYLQGGIWLESFRFWQHLANAKMIEGSYTGATTAAGVANNGVPGTNIPASRYPSLSWSLGPSTAITPTEGAFFAADYGTGHLFFVGQANGVYSTAGIIPSKDVWAIDKKYDDGKPGMGNIISSENSPCVNAANLNDLGTTYKLTANAACYMMFLASF